MAQFVGGESKYNGILSGFGEIYKENGLLGTDSNALLGDNSIKNYNQGINVNTTVTVKCAECTLLLHIVED